MSEQLLSHTQDHTLVLTISNPEHRNALGPAVYSAGVEALNAAEANPEVRAVVITGAGATFCAGGNLNRLLANRERPVEVSLASINGLHDWIEAIRTFPKPVVAAVEGAAAGAGCSLALACDMLVAASNAVFVMAYSTVGLSPDGCGTWHLARGLPRATAMRLLMLGERATAAELQQWGVLSHLSAPGQALNEALALAQRLSERAGNALASIKELVNDASHDPLHTHLTHERQHFVRNLHHHNAAEGIDAFLNKRPPRYTP